MNIMKKKYWVAIVIALVLAAIVGPYMGVRTSHNPEVHEGDVIFQTSKSRQSPLIAAATLSPITHCGVIVMKNGKPYVLEAGGIVKLTPLDRFIDRGLWGMYWVKHPEQGDANMKLKYRNVLGTPYDLAFDMNNRKYYCGELVYDLYLKQYNTQLCEPTPIGSRLTWGMGDEMKRRGMDLKSLAVSPKDIFFSSHLD